VGRPDTPFHRVSREGLGEPVNSICDQEDPHLQHNSGSMGP
jgi:hypothetical protein